jgi:hypothetical protein
MRIALVNVSRVARQFGDPKGNETPPEPEKNQKRTGESTCKIMEQEENRQISSRRSWTTTHMGNLS